MAQSVDVKGLQFVGPDGKVVQCPSWDFIVEQFSVYIGQLNTAIDATNADLAEIIQTVDTWPKKEEEGE